MDFSQINKIKNLLNKKEKFIISFLFILMFLNSLIEILSIGILIPLITITTRINLQATPSLQMMRASSY